ncbi:MAG: dihydrodipicolinate reductase C-terminal domain-containing protein [Robiginitomaculum sp.]
MMRAKSVTSFMGNGIMNIGIIGAEGKMGQALVSQITASKQAKLTCALVNPKSENIGRICGGVPLSSDLQSGLEICDVIIDFSTPKTTLEAATLMQNTRCKALVTGTTGYSAEEEEKLLALGKNAILVKSGNFSIGICVLDILVEQASRLLPKDWRFDILDIHHKHKLDAPSGTALMLGNSGEKTVGRTADYKDIRRGDIIGEHYVNFSSPLETITLSHKANERSIFAQGALHAALWAYYKPAGLYSMRDVLGLKS